MCGGCWAEAGSPAIDTPEVRRVAKLVEGCCDYGNTHVVVDDWNVDDRSIDYVLGLELPAHEREAMVALRALPVDQRHSAMALCAGFWKP